MSISILGINIKKIRESKGISAYKLCKLANVGGATISEIESGKRQSLNTNTIEKIASALEVKTDDLFTAEDNKEYIVSDIIQTIGVILTSDELLLDDKEMTETEKEQFKIGTKAILDMIRLQRK